MLGVAQPSETMSKPKDMTPEHIAKRREYNRIYGISRRRAKGIPKRVKLPEHEAKERKLINARTLYNADPDKFREYQKNYRARNPEKTRDGDSRRNRRKSSQLTAGYIAKRLGLKLSNIPPDLLDVKLEHLKILRKLKTKPKKQNAQESQQSARSPR